MKQLTFLSKFFFLALAISFVSSCGDDGTGEIVLPPVVALQSGTDLVTSATTVDAGATFQVRVIADKGDNDLTTFTVLEDGIAIDEARLNYNNSGSEPNPYTLPSSAATIFDTNIEITAHDSGTRTYTFRITDSANETDDTSVDISITSAPLAIGFDGSNGGITADATLNSQTNFLVQIIASKGASPLSTISILEDGTAIEATRATFNTVNDFSSGFEFIDNPLVLVGDEKTGINWFVWVSSHDSGTKTYTYRITAENGDTEEVSLDISIFSGTAVSEQTAKLLSNADGSGAQGGINLLTGASTFPSAMDAHLRDQGIDGGPIATNWIKKFIPTNGSILKTPGIDFPVNDFNAVDYAEDIVLAYDNGIQISETDEVNIDDKFLVRAATGETFLILVTDVVETATDNNDYFQFSIKY